MRCREQERNGKDRREEETNTQGKQMMGRRDDFLNEKEKEGIDGKKGFSQ